MLWISESRPMDPVPAKLRILLIEDQRPMAENIW